MIERCYGEFLWGLDVMSKKLDETNMTLWLQRESLGDTEKFSLDDCGSIDFGLPKVSQKISSPGGIAGGFFDGRPTIGNREFTFTTHFRGDNNKPALNGERIDKVARWFLYNPMDKMWLYWRVRDRAKTYRIEVRPAIKGEKYKKLAIADGITVTLTAEKSYFEAVEATYFPNTDGTTVAVTAGTALDITIMNTGIDTPFVMEFQPNNTCPWCELTNQTIGQGWTSNMEIIAGLWLSVDHRDGTVKIAGQSQESSFFSGGSIFSLVPGINTLRFRAAVSGSLRFYAKERIL
jgi:hypothetical protein